MGRRAKRSYNLTTSPHTLRYSATSKHLSIKPEEGDSIIHSDNQRKTYFVNEAIFLKIKKIQLINNKRIQSLLRSFCC